MADGGGGPGRVTYAAELGEDIRLRVAAGESLMAVCRGPGMPHRTTVREWAKAQPDFGEGLLAAMRLARLRRR
ncbi:MAG: hypothetical protein ABW360_11415, partial [Phenylobacterium sp.]